MKAGGWSKTGTSANAFGTRGDWSGDCAKLAWISWFRAGRTPVSKPTAWAIFKAHYDTSPTRGTGTLPQYGALVGFKPTSTNPAGHIAIAIGGARIASTQGRDGDGLENQRLSTTMTGYGAYAGWAVIP